MLLLDFWMQYEEKGARTKKRFTLHGEEPELRLDLDGFPYIRIRHGNLFEIEGENIHIFIPRAKSETGEPFSVQEVLQDVLQRLARNETGILELVYVSEIVKTYVDAFHKAIAAHQGRDIPYYIIFDERLLKLEFATDRFLYYDDDLEMPVMFRTEDGTLVSDNEFAEIGYYQSLDAIEQGEETALTLKSQPEWSLQEFVATCFAGIEKDKNDFQEN